MSYNISKELFEKVMNVKLTTDLSIAPYYNEVNGCEEEDLILINYNFIWIPLDTFFFKCKEWAIKENRENKIINNGDHFYINHIGSWMIGYFENYQCDVGYRGKNKDETFADLTKHFTADSEQQAVFDACMYILDKDKQ